MISVIVNREGNRICAIYANGHAGFDKSGREEIIKGELSTAFVIAEGGNMFSNIVSDTK